MKKHFEFPTSGYKRGFLIMRTIRIPPMTVNESMLAAMGSFTRASVDLASENCSFHRNEHDANRRWNIDTLTFRRQLARMRIDLQER